MGLPVVIHLVVVIGGFTVCVGIGPQSIVGTVGFKQGSLPVVLMILLFWELLR